jgi:catechol 2,3-dioxygenase-like lactoylglutathione lyase family enzyme
MSTTGTSIQKIGNVVVPVADQAAAIAFYTEKLGLEVRVDVPLDESFHWVEVAPAGAETTIAIVPPPPGKPTGNRETGITFVSADLEGLYDELKGRGVDVDAEITRYGGPVPAMFWFRDHEANTLLVVDANHQG